MFRMGLRCLIAQNARRLDPGPGAVRRGRSRYRAGASTLAKVGQLERQKSSAADGYTTKMLGIRAYRKAAKKRVGRHRVG